MDKRIFNYTPYSLTTSFGRAFVRNPKNCRFPDVSGICSGRILNFNTPVSAFTNAYRHTRAFQHQLLTIHSDYAMLSKFTVSTLRKSFWMFRFIILLAAALFVISCNKVVEPEEEFLPKMNYINLSDTALSFGDRPIIFDLDGDGQNDIRFNTLLVGDPVNQVDKRQWYAYGYPTTNLAINDDDKMPVLPYMQDIPVTNFSGYTWYNANQVLLVQRIEGSTGQPYWEGDWKNANHHYIPIQIIRNNALYSGWIEVSFSTNNQKLILHKAALCKEENRLIKAGK